jgi:hypothetical protein
VQYRIKCSLPGKAPRQMEELNIEREYIIEACQYG